MNVQVKDKFTVKYKRKEHPNARKYPGRPSMEFGTALRKFLSDLTAQERKDFQKGELVFEEEASAEFFDSVEVGDVIGVGLLYGIKDLHFNELGEPCAYQFEVLEVDKGADTMKARHVTFKDKEGNVDEEYAGQEVELAFEDLSAALGLGFGEILEKNGKPFGVSEEIEEEVLVVGPAEEEEKKKKKKATKKKKVPAKKKKKVTPKKPKPGQRQYYYKFEKDTDDNFGDCHSVVWVSTHKTFVDDNFIRHLDNAVETAFKNIGVNNPDNLMEGCWGIDTAQQVKALEQELKKSGWQKGTWPDGV